MTSSQLHILQHALGLDDRGQGTAYRNHYVCGPEGDAYNDCCELVGLGLMNEHKPSSLTGGMSLFVVTDAGKEAVRRESPDRITPLRDLERAEIFKALRVTNGSVAKAARLLGIGRATLYRRIDALKAQGIIFDRGVACVEVTS